MLVKDIFLRFWNTVKIPLIILFIVVIVSLYNAINSSEGFELIMSWDYWEGTLRALSLIILPGIASALDKWLRTQGIYIEQIFNGFHLPKQE